MTGHEQGCVCMPCEAQAEALAEYVPEKGVILHNAPEYEMVLMPPAVVYVLIVYYHFEHTEILGVYEDKTQAVNAALHRIVTKEVAKFQESNDNPCYWNGPNTDYEVKSFNVL